MAAASAAAHATVGVKAAIRTGGAAGVVAVRQANAGAALLHSPAGSCWRWEHTVAADPLQRLFDEAAQRAGVDASLQMSWDRSRGRHVRTCRPVRRGQLLLEAPAMAVITSNGQQPEAFVAWPVADQGVGSLDASAMLSHACKKTASHRRVDAAVIGLDDAHVALALALTQRQQTRIGEAAAAIDSLLSHAAAISVEDQDSWLRVARRLRATLLGAAPHCADGFCATDEAFTQLLLVLRANSHRVLDDSSQSRTVGLGLYPAAAMLNHSCFPSAAVSFADGGRLLRLRAIVNLQAGDEVSYSYLEESQLCSPWAERRTLLRAAHHFEPVEHPQRAASEAAALCRCSVDAERFRQLQEAARSAVARVQSAAAQLQALPRSTNGGGSGGCSGLADALRKEVDSLRAMVERELEPALHSAHWLVQDALASLMCAARALEDHGLLARSAMRLISAREEVLPLGTPQLANLYNAYGAALTKLLREGRVPTAKRPEAAEQAGAALEAALKIRVCCLGEQHVLCQATLAAHAAAVEQQRRCQHQLAGPTLPTAGRL